MKVLRILGMVLMVVWILNGAARTLMGFMGEPPVGFNLVAGPAQVALALWLLFKIHAWQPGTKCDSPN